MTRRSRRLRMQETRLVLVTVVLAGATASLPADAAVVVREKAANLDIAKRVTAILRDAGVSVTLTRTTDRTLTPTFRTGLANGRAVDAFVSIHNNASSSTKVSGSEVYRSLRHDGSRALGAFIHDELWSLGRDRRNLLRTRRGCCGDYYFQLRQTHMPAVIVEGAFVSNPTEGRLLGTSARFRRRIAEAIADGILRWQRTLVVRRAPRLDPGTHQTGPLPPPTEGVARALGATRVALSWRAAPTETAYRVYRNGRLIAVRTLRAFDPLRAPRVRLTDPWAAPGQRYTYEIRSVRGLGSGVFAESLAATLSARTPAISVVLDPGHGGRDPGAVARY